MRSLMASGRVSYAVAEMAGDVATSREPRGGTAVQRLHVTRGLFLALAVTVASGCGPGGPALYGVSGTVTIGGSPAQNVQVTFMPNDSALPVASGKVDAAGKYVLVSGNDNRPGAAAGSYKVVLAQLESGSQEEMEARYGGGGGGPPVPKASFPAEYRSADTSPKQVEVVVGANTIDIEIP